MNQYKVSKEEVDALIKCPSDVRYQYSLKRIADTEVMWSVADEEESCIIQTHDNQRLLPIWPFKEYAQVYGVDKTKEYKYIPIILDINVDSFIDLIAQEKLLINVFPTEKEPLGKIVGLNTFAEDLSVLLSDY